MLLSMFKEGVILLPQSQHKHSSDSEKDSEGGDGFSFGYPGHPENLLSSTEKEIQQEYIYQQQLTGTHTWTGNR